MSRYFLFTLFLLWSLLGFSQKEVIMQRYRSIDYWHYSVGVDVSAYNNYSVCPKVSLGMGSFRNWYSIDVGIGCCFVNPLHFSDSDDVSLQQLHLYSSVEIHPISWNNGCILVGEALGYNVPISSRYLDESLGVSEENHHIGYAHASIKTIGGFILSDWKLSLYYEYDMSPTFNQKYIYESTTYNFDAVRVNIYERHRFGLSFTYYFAL